jgi:trimeric autotransporter adhesin
MKNSLARQIFLPILQSAWLIASGGFLSAAPGDEHWDVQFGWPGTTNSVFALAVEGGKVYASGYYGTPALTETNFVEIWDGARWNYLPGLEGTLAIFDFAFFNGEMYVAGVFGRAGTNRAPGLARWNGSRWSDVGGFAGAVSCAISDGTKLYVGGTFTNAGNVITTNIACWDGSQWSAMADGLGAAASVGSEVSVLHLHQGVLYAGGAS